MTATEKLTNEEIDKVIHFLKISYILNYSYRSKIKEFVRIRHDIFTKKYFIEIADRVDDIRALKTVLEFENSDVFKSWLKDQDNSTLVKLIQPSEHSDSISIENIKECVLYFDRGSSMAGPYQIMDYRGDTAYAVHPIVASIDSGDIDLFEKSFSITTPDERSKMRPNRYRLLEFCLENKFGYGAKRLMDADGPCCGLNTYCNCLNQINYSFWEHNQRVGEDENKTFGETINFVIYDQIKNQNQLHNMLNEGSSLNFRFYLKRIFNNFKFDNPKYLLNRITRNYDFETTKNRHVQYEMDAFPEINLNQKNENKMSAFLLYLENCLIDEDIVINMLNMGANLFDKTPEGDSVLDLIFQNLKTPSGSKKQLRSKFYKLGCRSNKMNSFLRFYRNATSNWF